MPDDHDDYDDKHDDDDNDERFDGVWLHNKRINRKRGAGVLELAWV